MTVKEMLNVAFATGTIFKVMQHIKEVYYVEEDCSTEDLSERYIAAAQEMMECPDLPGCEGYNVVLKYEMDDGVQCVDTHLRDSQTNEVYSLSYTDWAELVDLEVICETKMELLEQLAHILWELTFHGFTREKINKSRAELIATMDEIKNGDATLVTWDELKSELKNLK